MSTTGGRTERTERSERIEPIGRTERAVAWIYRGIWGVIVELFKLPHEPPSLPVRGAQLHQSFQPSTGYLRYLKLHFWVILVIVDVALTVAWIVATGLLLNADQPVWAVAIAPPALALIVVPDVLAYIGIHLRYDTMWYVVTDRSLRIRRGLWVLHEVTITFENVQNVTVTQGPLERWFGIASVQVDTAGGGGGGGKDAHQQGTSHRGVIEGISNAPEIRDMILARVRASSSAGLGDERVSTRAPSGSAPARRSSWTSEHIAVLRGIRDELRGGASATP